MRRVVKVLVRGALALTLAIVVSAIALMLWVKHEYVDTLPDIELLATEVLQGSGDHQATTLAVAPLSLVQALVAVEDPDFFEHDAVDSTGILRALAAKMRDPSSPVRGPTAITQRLAKEILAVADSQHHQNFVRVLREVALAHRLEARLTKEQILCAYLNRLYLGQGVHGVVDASAVYFHEAVSRLTVAEVAALVATASRPSEYSPAATSEAARVRRRFVLDRMLATGAITREQHDAAVDELE